MSLTKRAKDQLIKFLLGSAAVPRGLADFQEYFRHYSNIEFRFETNADSITAISTNFRYGSIITSGKNEQELDKNIMDAILTSFEIPSSYAGRAQVQRVV